MSKPEDPNKKDPKKASPTSESDSVAEFYRAAPQPSEPTVVVSDGTLSAGWTGQLGAAWQP